MARRITKASAARRLSQAVTIFTRACAALPEPSDPQYEAGLYKALLFLRVIDDANKVYLGAD